MSDRRIEADLPKVPPPPPAPRVDLTELPGVDAGGLDTEQEFRARAITAMGCYWPSANPTAEHVAEFWAAVDVAEAYIRDGTRVEPERDTRIWSQVTVP